MITDFLLSKNKLEMCLYITSKDDVLIPFQRMEIVLLRSGPSCLDP